MRCKGLPGPVGRMLVVAVFPVLLGCLGCGKGNAGANQLNQLVITGASTIAPLVNDIAKRFEQAHPGTRIDVQTGGSARGVADVRRQTSQIGMVSRPLAQTENDLHDFIIARDGVCIIVHKDNPVESLSDKQIVDIYTGQITDWKQVGGEGPITVVNKAAGRSTLELFCNHFKLDERQIQAHVVIGDNEHGIKTVVGNPQAIGYVSIGTAAYQAEQGVPIKLLPVGDVPATVQNVQNGSFPLSRPLNLVTINPPQGLIKEFIDYAQSAEVLDLVEEHYFVPLAR